MFTYSVEKFNDLIKNEVVLVDFWATWCGPCNNQLKELEKFETKYSTVPIVKVNIEDEYEFTEKYKVTSVPTVIIFKNGQEQARLNSFSSLEKLEQEYLKN